MLSELSHSSIIKFQVEGEKELTLFDPHNNSNLYEAHIQEANLKFDEEAKLFIRKGLQDSTSLVMSPFDIQTPNFKVGLTFFSRRNLENANLTMASFF